MRFVDTCRIRTRVDERVRAPDGIELSVDLYLPAHPGRYPVLLNRTASDNNRAGRPGISLAPAERWKVLAAQGYIVAAADVRGRGDSDGTFIPFVREAADGAATLAWLRALDECNGRIGLFGTGYGAFCAWAAAVADRHVDAIASISPFGAVGEGLVHRGGAVRLDWLFWMHLIGGRSVQPANVPLWKSIYRHWPLLALEEVLGRSDIWWREWMTHLDSGDDFWRPLDLAGQIATLEVPGLHVTGQWDGYAQAAYYYYEAASRSGAPQELIVGPWDTAGTRRPVREIGGFDFGPRCVLDMDEVLTEFFDATLRQGRSSHRRESRKAAHLFVTGRNEWLDLASAARPRHSRETLDLYLSSALGANTRRGDGALSRMAPRTQVADVVTHNPGMPVNFQPHFVSFATGANPLGLTLDQAHLTARDEALVYTTSALEETVTVLGRPRVSLTVRTSAPDADLFVLLSDCFPLGTRDLNLAHSAVRLASLKEFAPDELLRIELELDAVAHDFFPGHQIRLTITPSLYPLYASNPQAKSYTTASEPAVVNIELHHGPRYSATLTLPVAPEGL